MKKYRIFSAFLAAVLTVNAWALPALAETEPPVQQETQESFVPTIPWATGTAPDLSGDASVQSGSHSIDAQVPIASLVEYNVKAKGAVLYELNTDTMLYAYNADVKLYPASLTKVMTCLLALELCQDLDETITVPESVIANKDPNGSGMDLVAGEELTMTELLYGLMVASANDAASTIAVHLAGSEEAFVRLMNRKATELGCQQTNFVNVHGLHHEEHYTTARDMARIMMAALEYEMFEELYSTTIHRISATNKSEERKLITTNYLISEAVYQQYYDPRVIGGKTGFTTPAGRCLVSVSEANGMRLLCVMMGGENTMSEDGSTIIAYGSFEQTRGLINYGFNNYTPAQVLSPNQTLGQFHVENSSSAAQGMVRDVTDTLVPVNSDMSTIRYEYTLDRETLTAPIAEGESIGVVRVWLHTKCLAQQELYSASAVVKDKPIVVSGGAVDPAQAVTPGSGLWHAILIIILALLGLIAALLLAGYIRASIVRAKRARRRKNRRRSR